MECFTRPCPYLEGRTSRLEVLSGEQSEGFYESLLAEGWRRSGTLFYRNVCEDCSQCIPLRRLSSASCPPRGKRLFRANADLEVSLNGTCFDMERFSLYSNYMTLRHGESGDLAESYSALIASPLSRFVDYRLPTGRLIALGFVDLATRSLSSAYFAFGAEESRRSLGSFSVYAETDLAGSLGKEYYYLGFWVPGSPKMRYKADFHPFELLLDGASGHRFWVSFGSRTEAEAALGFCPDR
jgi:arginine-tRNA-protein transferase